MRSLSGFLKSQVSYQCADMKGVKIEYRWSDRDRSFYLNSPAGLIRFRPKTERALTEFRNIYVNKLWGLHSRHSQGENVTKDLFRLYKQIRKDYKVSYKANLRTRLKCILNR